MKKIAFLLSFLAMVTFTFAQKKVASPRVTVTSEKVTVSYGQPSKKRRVIFGGLEKFGTIWRTGANEATEITFKKDVNFGGKSNKSRHLYAFLKN